MNSSLTDRGTDIVAGAAVVSPFWLPWLQQTSEVAGLLVPILGTIWLVVQIITHVNRKK